MTRSGCKRKDVGHILTLERKKKRLNFLSKSFVELPGFPVIIATD